MIFSKDRNTKLFENIMKLENKRWLNKSQAFVICSRKRSKKKKGYKHTNYHWCSSLQDKESNTLFHFLECLKATDIYIFFHRSSLSVSSCAAFSVQKGCPLCLGWALGELSHRRDYSTLAKCPTSYLFIQCTMTEPNPEKHRGVGSVVMDILTIKHGCKREDEISFV